MINTRNQFKGSFIEYKRHGEVRAVLKQKEPLKIKRDENGEFTNLVDGEKYSLSQRGKSFIYPSVYNDKFNTVNRFQNSMLQLPDRLFDELETPPMVTYDIETNEHAFNKAKARVTSIAWENVQTGETFCNVVAGDTTEYDIIEEFCEYLLDNDIMSLVTFNGATFDNKIMVDRIRAKNMPFEYQRFFYNECNLDVMILASFFQYSSGKYISLNELSNLLGLGSKVDTGAYNPVSLYYAALEDEELMAKFKDYNIQDVVLTTKCLKAMNVIPQLEELFKLTHCPWSKIQFNQELLNSYTCKKMFERKLVLTDYLDTKIGFKNAGGFNYYKQSDELQVHEDVVCLDVVSYYPHLMMLLKANNLYDYPNIDKANGHIGKFNEDFDEGLLSELASELYNTRAAVKSQMKESYSDELDYKQKTLKIVVNSLYGVLSTRSNGYYVLKNELLGATITKMGRDILEHTIKQFDGVYGKTDSIFVPLRGRSSEDVLEEANAFVTQYIKERYNLDNNGLIQFEVDSVIDKLIILNKNNYVKVIGDELNYKGPSFASKNLSEFELELRDYIVRNIGADKNSYLEFTKQKISEHEYDLTYWSKTISLSEKQGDSRIMLGREYMDNNDIQYFWNFRYQYCMVSDPMYEYIMFPAGHKPVGMYIKHNFVYELMNKMLRNLKQINDESYRKQAKVLHTKRKVKASLDKNQSKLM